MKTRLALFAGTACLLLAIPGVHAHAAPDPRDQDTRLLADWNDDCGGDGGAATGACRGSIDVVALDVHERYDAALGDVVVFRFILDKGQPGSQTVKLLLDAGDRRTFTLTTSNDATFAGSGFDRVGNAVGLNDGTRFSVEATIATPSLGAVGRPIANFRVESWAGANLGDFMPGGCHNTVGDCIDTGQSSTLYTRPSYALRGPGYYASLTSLGGPLTPTPDARTEVEVKNGLRATAQSFTLTATTTTGTVRFLDQAGQEKDSINVGLAGGKTGQATLIVRATSAGQVTVDARSDLGGRTTLELPFTSGGGQATSPATRPPETKDSPAAPFAVVVVALLAAVLRRR